MYNWQAFQFNWFNDINYNYNDDEGRRDIYYNDKNCSFEGTTFFSNYVEIFLSNGLCKSTYYTFLNAYKRVYNYRSFMGLQCLVEQSLLTKTDVSFETIVKCSKRMCKWDVATRLQFSVATWLQFSFPIFNI
jgi:hypothetical protein